MCKTLVSFGLKDYFKSFKSKYPQSVITSSIHIEILEQAGFNISEVLLEDGEFKLGNRAGELKVRMVVPRAKPFDYGHFNKTGERRFHLNDHTDGNIAKVFWMRRNAVLFDKFLWDFTLAKRLRVAITNRLNEGKADYPMYHNRESQ